MKSEREPIVLVENTKHFTKLLSKDEASFLQKSFSRNVLEVRNAWDFDEPGHWELVVWNHVGEIILGDLRIIVKPKIPLTNLFYMLTYAYKTPQFRDEKTLLDIGDDIFEFIVSIFIKQVDQLVRSGIYRSYVEEQENRRYLRGRLLISEHLRQNPITIHKFFQRTHEFTADVLENRILKYVIWNLSRLPFRISDLNRHLRRTYTAFAEVELAPLAASDCDQVVYTRLNQSYQPKIQLAQLLLQHLSLEGHAGGQRFASYLLPMSQVFEYFVAEFLKEVFAGYPKLDVAIQSPIWLDIEGKEKAKPDIILRRNGKDQIVLDTKYKDFDKKPKDDDRNQMYIYCDTQGLKLGVLIYATDHIVEYSRPYADLTLQADSLTLKGNMDTFRENCLEFARKYANYLEFSTVMS